MTLTAFAILIYLWSRPTQQATLAEVQTYAGGPDLPAILTSLQASGHITFDGITLTLSPAVTPELIVDQAGAVLSPDERAAVVQLMLDAAGVPPGDTFLVEAAAAGYTPDDAFRSSVFARVAAALRSKKNDDRLVANAARSSDVSAFLGSRL